MVDGFGFKGQSAGEFQLSLAKIIYV